MTVERGDQCRPATGGGAEGAPAHGRSRPVRDRDRQPGYGVAGDGGDDRGAGSPRSKGVGIDAGRRRGGDLRGAAAQLDGRREQAVTVAIAHREGQRNNVAPAHDKRSGRNTSILAGPGLTSSRLLPQPRHGTIANSSSRSGRTGLVLGCVGETRTGRRRCTVPTLRRESRLGPFSDAIRRPRRGAKSMCLECLDASWNGEPGPEATAAGMQPVCGTGAGVIPSEARDLVRPSSTRSRTRSSLRSG